jgi:NADH dehydrogenase
MPIRRLFRKAANVEVILDEVTSVDVSRNTVITLNGEVAYDYLVVAAGATHSYFGHDEWGEAAPGLKTVEDAIVIRQRVLVAFEAAERESDPAIKREWTTFVVIGGGPTGVELAGAIAEIGNKVIERDFRSTGATRVTLVEAGPRLLPTMSEKSSENALRQLRKLGVEVMLGVPVTAVDDNGVTRGAEKIRARTAIWAAGVAANPLGAKLGATLDRAGRVQVNADLTVPGAPHMFVVGDLAAITQDGKPVPGVAPAAMQEGRHAARNLLRAIAGKPLEPFRYLDKGSLATIGKGAAVADIGRFHLSGLLAWLAWAGIHIVYLLGGRNRIVTLTEWAWMYFRNDRGARVIIGDVEPLLERGTPIHQRH